jgi:nitrate reductase NapAB chaperone NapD
MLKHKDEMPYKLKQDINALKCEIKSDYKLSGKLVVLMEFIKKWD